MVSIKWTNNGIVENLSELTMCDMSINKSLFKLTKRFTGDTVGQIRTNSFILEVKCQLCADVGLTPLTGGASVSWSTLAGTFVWRAGSSILTVTGEGAVWTPAALCTHTVTVDTCSDTKTQTHKHVIAYFVQCKPCTILCDDHDRFFWWFPGA